MSAIRPHQTSIERRPASGRTGQSTQSASVLVILALSLILHGGCGSQLSPSEFNEPAKEPRSGLVCLNSERGETCFVVVNGLAVTDGDVILGRAEEFLGSAGIASRQQGLFWRHRVNLWNGGEIPYVIVPSSGGATFSQSNLDDLFAAMRQVSMRTNVVWKARDKELSYVEITPIAGRVCYAAVGKVTGAQSLQIGIEGRGCVVHEMGHTMGLEHEHQRPDRDSFIRVIPENIKAADRRWFDIIRLGDASSAYNAASIMHYASYNGFSVDPQTRPTHLLLSGDSVPYRCVLSREDAAEINRRYPGTGAKNLLVKTIDFDGDGKADRYAKDSDGRWYIDFADDCNGRGFGARDVYYSGYGGTSFQPTPADYDGDGITDLSVKSDAGFWGIDYSSNGFGAWDWQSWLVNQYGDASFRPAPADYDGDGRADIAVKGANGFWGIDYAANGFGGWDWQSWLVNQYGDASFRPAPADYDGDGKLDIAVKSDHGFWGIDYAANGLGGWDWQSWLVNQYGDASFHPIPADYDGDGKADIAVQGTNGFFGIDYSKNGFGGWDLQR
ncbi:M12 family metallopeptidase [Haliangium sp. UPWRP_2]|uniref:M12 family metallopeptidase n=1 Tax=Haliangium sp. UPWRP_2 TaxID=1931276 RepID=UPI000D0D0004|nr:M12 family metallopeptidase [Haliangium sp. UPWRP_2]PSM31551.1 hypothetical protein BVG81_004845 [Haliangium sp. UPWRP_2]